MSKIDKKILIVTTNYQGDENSKIQNTGVYLEEYAVPYLVLKATGYEITTASPQGGLSPIDETSMSCSNPVEWDECIKILRKTTKLSEVNYENYDALYLPGGHGPMFDLSNNILLKEIVEYFYEKKKLISAICHGSAGLILAKKDNGESILKGKLVTALTNKEEHIGKTDTLVPFLLETRLRELGANFEESEPWTEHVCIDEQIITGQNPQSSLLLAEKIIENLKK